MVLHSDRRGDLEMNMKWENHGLKTPLARARGLGASRSAVGAWIGLRVSAIALLLLTGWFVWFISTAIGTSHEEFTAKLADPRNAIAMILFIVAGFYHAVAGSREVVEDYFHNEFMKLFKLIGMYLFFFAMTVACVFSVLKIAFTAGI